jgi:hypothetical protein
MTTPRSSAIQKIPAPGLSIADTIWLATALLHEQYPSAAGFEHAAILRRVADLDPRYAGVGGAQRTL